MVTIVSLWVPIVLSAVIVFVASSILHMVMTYHQSEYRKLPDEDVILDAIRSKHVTPGFYAFPHHSGPKEMKTPQMMEKFKNGPVGFVTLIPNGPPAMGKYLGLWFGFCILMGILVAYITGRTLSHEAHYLAVFRVAGAVAFMGYSVGHLTNSIWMGQPWSATIKHMFDGLVYSLLTAGTFGWLWPR